MPPTLPSLPSQTHTLTHTHTYVYVIYTYIYILTRAFISRFPNPFIGTCRYNQYNRVPLRSPFVFFPVRVFSPTRNTSCIYILLFPLARGGPTNQLFSSVIPAADVLSSLHNIFTHTSLTTSHSTLLYTWLQCTSNKHRSPDTAAAHKTRVHKMYTYVWFTTIIILLQRIRRRLASAATNGKNDYMCTYV